MYAASTCVAAQRATVGVRKRTVPSRRQGDSARIERAVRVVADALRAIGHPDRRDAQSRDRTDIEAVVTPDIGELFLQSHAGNQFRGARLGFRGDTLGSSRKREDNR